MLFFKVQASSEQSDKSHTEKSGRDFRHRQVFLFRLLRCDRCFGPYSIYQIVNKFYSSGLKYRQLEAEHLPSRGIEMYVESMQLYGQIRSMAL
jgi:hypothetical protein